jgi:hypothetical protein
VIVPPTPVVTGGQQPPGTKAIPFAFKGESNDGFTIKLQFHGPACLTTQAQVKQTPTITTVTLLPQNSCTGASGIQQRAVKLQSHFFPCTSALLDGATGKPAPILKKAHIPAGACPGTP